MSGHSTANRRGRLIALAIGVLFLALLRLGARHVLVSLPVPAATASVPAVAFTGEAPAFEAVQPQSPVDGESYARIGLQAQTDDAVRHAEQAQEQIEQGPDADAR